MLPASTLHGVEKSTIAGRNDAQIKENEKFKILTKEQPGKENHGEDEEVDVVVES